MRGADAIVASVQPLMREVAGIAHIKLRHRSRGDAPENSEPPPRF